MFTIIFFKNISIAITPELCRPMKSSKFDTSVKFLKEKLDTLCLDGSSTPREGVMRTSVDWMAGGRGECCGPVGAD